MHSRTPPPPLQLLHDNTIPEAERQPFLRTYPRPAPPRAEWRTVKLFKKLYRSDWRVVVIAVAAINLLRYSVFAANAFEHITPAALRHVPRLTQVSSSLGWIYAATAVIQGFGVVSAYLKRLTLIRIYAYLSFISALLITSAAFVHDLSYFLLGGDVIKQCIALSLVGSDRTMGLYRTKALRSSIPSLSTALRQCVKAYNHPQTPAALIPLSILVFSLLPAVLFVLLSYTYYKQTTDPRHPACLSTGPVNLPASNEAPLRTSTAPTRGRSTTRGKGNARPWDRTAHWLRTRNRPNALPLEQLGLLGDSSAVGFTSSNPTVKSVDITSIGQPRPHKGAVQNTRTSTSSTSTSRRSPYNITPGPPSFRHGHAGVAAVGSSRAVGNGVLGLRAGAGGFESGDSDGNVYGTGYMGNYGRR